MLSAIIDIIITWAETKILKENEMDSPNVLFNESLKQSTKKKEK